jgi:hypothetical protein
MGKSAKALRVSRVILWVVVFICINQVLGFLTGTPLLGKPVSSLFF